MSELASGLRPNRSLLIVQEYVPAYRLAFFSNLIERLAGQGVLCRIAAASPGEGQSDRGDSVQADWIIHYDPKRLRIGNRSILLGGARSLWSAYDAVIVGHLGSSLDTHAAIYDAALGRLNVGLWGHIKSYVRDGNPIDLALERWQLGRADHIFAYTPGGRDYALSFGVDPAKVTTVMNATDTGRLQQARRSVSAADRLRFMKAHDLKMGRTLAFIGGLDSSKRIDFLAAVLDQLWDSDPDVKIVIGGRGADAHLLEAARCRGQAIMLGYATIDDQAVTASVSSALLMPGRIGLVAVDALVLGLPVITTNWPYHAPEHEYLVESVTRFTSPNDVYAYASVVRKFLDDAAVDPKGTSGQDWVFPTLDGMVENFASGVMKLLGAI